MIGSKKHSRFVQSAFNAIEALEARQLLSTTVPNLTYALQFKAPAVILPGSKQTATLEIKNTGSSLIETFLPITVDVSDTPTLAADSNQHAILTIDPALRLMGGKSKNMAIHFTMPASFVTGTCYILVNVDGQVFSTSSMYNPSGGYGTGVFGNAPKTGNDATEYLDTGTWTANGQTNTFSINLRNVASGAMLADVLASGNFGEISMFDLPAHISSQGNIILHANGISATIYQPGSSNTGSGNTNNNNSGGSDSGNSGGNDNSSGGSDSGTSGGSDTGTSGGSDTGTSTSVSTETEEVSFSLNGKINSGQIDGGVRVKSINPTSTTGSTGTTGSTTGEGAAVQTTGSLSNFTKISNNGSFDVAPPPAQSAGGSASAIVLDMSQLPAITSSNITLTGNYPTQSYVGTISVSLTNSRGNSLTPFTTYTVNTAAGTWAVPISIAGVPDGVYTVNVTDTNTGGTTLTPDSGGTLTISTIGASVHFNASQLPLVTNTNQTLTGTYDKADADGGTITHITITLTDFAGNQTFFPATLNGGTWSAPASITSLADGAYTVTATATDSAGNAGTAGAPGTFTIDTPVTTLASDVQFTSINALPWLATTNTPFTIAGTYTDPDLKPGNPDGNPDFITAIIINLADSQGNVKSFPAIVNNDGTWSALINVSSLTAGTYTVTATISDSNGNIGIATPASTFTVLGLSPAEMRDAYGLGQIGSSSVTFNGIQGDGSGQTIAIVDAYDDPNAQADLEAFDEQFGLPNPPSFAKFNEQGESSPLPGTQTAGTSSSWEMEESLDIEWAHVMAPKANIDLFEANSDGTATGANTPDLYITAQAAAATPGVDVVSMSFGAAESSDETTYDSDFVTPSNHLGGAASVGGTDLPGSVTFVAASGDDGASAPAADYLSVSYPAASPNVVAVGGTILSVNGNSYGSETGWSGGGGGVSVYETQPLYQTDVVTQSATQRTVPDVSMDAAPNTGVPIYDSYDSATNPWMNMPIGGTSLATPMFAAIVAIADQGRAINGLGSLSNSQTLQTLYSAGASDFHDVTSGSNGYYSAGPGYDLVTGLGSPVANRLVPDLAGVPISQAQPAFAANYSGRGAINNYVTKSADANDSSDFAANNSNSSIFSDLPIMDSVTTKLSVL